MKFLARFHLSLPWFNLPVAALVALLQRTPVVRVAATASELIHASPVAHVLRSALAAVASLGALHTLAGATTLSVSSGSTTGVTGAAGTALGPIALGTIGTLGQPLSWQISGVIPTGLSFLNGSGASLTTGGTLNTPSGVMLLTGTPTAAAGTYPLTLIAYEGANRTLTASPTFTYSIVIAGRILPAPSIAVQPASLVLVSGDTAVFTVVATGSTTYKWLKDGTPIAGASNTTFTIGNVQSNDAGAYTVVIGNANGTTTSNSARLTVNVPAAISAQPLSQTTNAGTTATFTVTATGTAPFSYQWRKDGSPIAGATNSTFTLGTVLSTDAGNYSVSIGNAYGTTTSSPAVLAVNVPAAITTQPISQTINAGTTATFTVATTGTAPISYQWRKDGSPIAGATNERLTLNGVRSTDAGSYTVTVTNVAGSSTSSAATLAVTLLGRLINLSVLTDIATPGDEFTLGYVVGGTDTSGSKPLVIRAAGPSLGALGVSGTLDDPKLELFGGSNSTGGNDNWGGSPQLTAAIAAVGAFAYTSPFTKDAAVAYNTTTRDNSVKISAVGSGSGKVIAEIYDATPSALFTTTTPRLINVSVRKHLGTGLTVGFVLGGGTTAKVLIRAVGPTLGGFGVPDTVVDPQLTVFNDKSEKIGENDNWGGTAALTTAFGSVGAFALPATSKDAALLATLPPGLYSVLVTGVATTTGAALVEVYEVP